jgi:HEPN domain-containing protein
MKASTREWVGKADEDFAVALALARPRKKPLWAPLCFHAQQYVEKCLKVWLNEASIPFPKTHDPELIETNSSGRTRRAGWTPGRETRWFRWWH